jgi:hypothetical protein
MRHESATKPRASKIRRGRMQKCECDCGGESISEFLPGHDQKLRARLEKRVGGVLSLRSIVDAAEDYARGGTSEELLLKKVRSVFAKTSLA